MIRKSYALKAAQKWRYLAWLALDIRDRCDIIGDRHLGTTWQEEYEDRVIRAEYWQRLADGPAWRRWLA